MRRVDGFCKLAAHRHPRFVKSNGYNHRDEFSERVGFQSLHYPPTVFLDGPNCNSQFASNFLIEQT